MHRASRGQAALADPNNGSPVQWYAESTDAALRHVAHHLLQATDDDDATQLLDNNFSKGMPPRETRAALEYLQKRVGVPRDMSYPAARELRSHLAWAIANLDRT